MGSIYKYFKDCSIAKSHKLGGVVEKHCLPIELMWDLEEPDSESPRDKFPKYLRREDEPVNSESIERQFRHSDVYYSTAAILNRDRAPCSRAKGKGNGREGKGARRKGQIEANGTECTGNPG